MASRTSIRFTHATAPSPGAIAILQLHGDDCEQMLRKLTGVDDWPVGRMRLSDFAGIDEGVAGLLAPNVAQLMPHGGMRVVQRLTAWLLEAGATLIDASNAEPRSLFPEAGSELESLMLFALSRAASPLAIDLLLSQPARWSEFHALGQRVTDEHRARSHVLNRLIDPPVVVLAGAPNVGKSTLSNALLGRAMSIAADLPGTTRDFTAGRIDLAGLVVDWHDTPGLRHEADAIEARAIVIARGLMERAALLIAMRDADHDWPELPRPADVFVENKVDDLADQPQMDAGREPSRPLRISARTGCGIAQLVRLLRDFLVPPEAFVHAGPWMFDPRLDTTSHDASRLRSGR